MSRAATGDRARSAVPPKDITAEPVKRRGDGVRGITICVEYDDILAITLARNLRYLDEMVVVTSPEDIRTQQLVRNTPRARLFATDAFYRQGAAFNKGLAMEEGFEFMGREGWIMILDADIVLPQMDWSFLQPNHLFSPFRHTIDDPKAYHDSLDWSAYRIVGDQEFAGYCQLFQAEDERLVNRRPWYTTNWWHAGGSDSEFNSIWPYSMQIRPPFNVMHLGKANENWCGRVTPRVDEARLPDQSGRRANMDRLISDWNYRVSRLPSE